jgi:hypothetical protein
VRGSAGVLLVTMAEVVRAPSAPQSKLPVEAAIHLRRVSMRASPVIILLTLRI